MNSTNSFPGFSAQLREFIRVSTAQDGVAAANRMADATARQFDALVLELFGLQYHHNLPYRQLCDARGVTPERVEHWSQIPSVPTAAFKDLELSCLPAGQRSAVFHSSGTTEQRPSRHFHNEQSLALYEASALPWFARHLAPEVRTAPGGARPLMVILTPPASAAPQSSLVHMFELARTALGAADSAFFGSVGGDGSWRLDAEATLAMLAREARARRPVLLLGTAFLFVHLLDFLAGRGICLELPAGSRVLETGGYKGRSRSLPKGELHSLMAKHLGVSDIVCEYGMSELSSQAYDRPAGQQAGARRFRFPPWARVELIAPETGRAVEEGQTGLIRVVDLANVFSVLSIQTEDLGVRRGDGFELLGRAAFAEARGCSLMAL